MYRVCVANDMNHLLTKTVQLDIRAVAGEAAVAASHAKPKLVTNPDQLTEEQRKEEAAKEHEVGNRRCRSPRLAFAQAHPSRSKTSRPVFYV